MTSLSKAFVFLVTATSISACVTLDETFEPAPPVIPSKTNVAPPSVTLGIERYMEQRTHVESVGFRLRKAANQECHRVGKSKADLGIVVWSLANFPNPEDQQRLRASYSLTNAVTVAIAAKSGPAHAAGLAAGDVVASVNGEEIPAGIGATERFISLSNQAAKQGRVIIGLANGRSYAINPVSICEHPALLVRSPETNAAADGTSVAITTALYDVTQSDDELALVLGHELAHNVLNHLKQGQDTPPKSGRLLDALLRSSISAALTSQATPPHSQAKEREADHVGLYIMARAGFDVSSAERLWAHLSRSTNASLLAKTHPSAPDRLAAIRQTTEEIRAKQNSGQPLNFPLTPHQ